MSDISITDKDSLKAFLDGVEEPRRKQAAVFIAARAALRVVPVLHGLFDVEHNKKTLDTLPVFRPLLISSVAATMPTDDIKRASANAAANADSWRAIQQDADLWVEHADAETGNLSIDIAPLWDGAHPLDADWQTLQDRMRTDPSGADWSFWITWYQGILDGAPQNWPLLHEIATTDRIDWDAPAKEVNDKINGIVEAYALKNSYYFERIEFSEATQKLIAVPEGSFDGNTVEMAYQRLRDAIEEVRAASRETNA